MWTLTTEMTISGEYTAKFWVEPTEPADGQMQEAKE